MIVRLARLVACLAAAAVIAACANPFGPHYEYEEQVYLSVDGRATVVVDASLFALVALRGAAIDPSVDGPSDRDSIRRVFEAAHCTVDNVSRFWTRNGRRFVQVSIANDELSQLPACGLLAWSAYSLTPMENDGLRYLQSVAAGPTASPASAMAGWNGTEIVAFKLHVPSRIRFQNVKRLDGTNGAFERGNILTWEQRLSDRLAGKPVAMEVHMDSTSILHTTLWLFGGAFAAAVLMLVLIIWLVVRHGRRVKL